MANATLRYQKFRMWGDGEVGEAGEVGVFYFGFWILDFGEAVRSWEANALDGFPGLKQVAWFPP